MPYQENSAGPGGATGTQTRAARRGVGLRLLAAAMAACRTAKLFTSTNQSNLAAQRLFAGAGFVRSGHIEHLDEGDPELLYVSFLR